MRKGELVTFSWPVCPDGYQWLPVPAEAVHPPLRPGEERMERPIAITDGERITGPVAHARHEVLRNERLLFRTFAALDKTEDAIADFACRYGLLGVAPVAVYVPLSETADTIANGELLSTWIAEIKHMHAAVTAWDLASQRNDAALRKLIKWTRNAIIFNNDEVETEIARVNRGIPSGEVVLPAKLFVVRTVNQRIDGLVGPEIRWDTSTSEPVMRIVPKSLLGALWFQFAQSLSGVREYRSCRNCGKAFEVSSDGAKRSKQYCSSGCRVSRFRNKQAANPANKRTGRL